MPGEDEPVSMELDLGEPSSKLLEYAKKELGENPDTRAQVIQEFRDFIFEKGEVLPHRTDDAFLLRFLRARYFQVRRAHRLLVNYYTFKESNPQIHNNVNPLKMGFIGDDDILTVLPYRDQTGRRLLIYRIGNWDPSKYSAEEIFKATVIVLELGILEERAQILGGVCVFDLEGLSLQHAWNVTPSVASKITELMVTSFPMKIHAVHIINQSWVFDMVFGVFRHMLDERMLEKIFIHGSNLEALHTHVNPKSLPEKYGGTRPEYSYREWLDTLKVNPKIVEEMSSLGYIIDQHDTESYY